MVGNFVPLVMHDLVKLLESVNLDISGGILELCEDSRGRCLSGVIKEHHISWLSLSNLNINCH
jgi:hypothetical protein